MSPKMPAVSGDDVRRALEKAGFKEASQKGSHVKMKHEDGRIAIVPMHRELKKGTLASVLRQAALTVEQLLQLIRN